MNGDYVYYFVLQLTLTVQDSKFLLVVVRWLEFFFFFFLIGDPRSIPTLCYFWWNNDNEAHLGLQFGFISEAKGFMLHG